MMPPFHHYYRPSNLQNPISLFAITSPSISATDPPTKRPQQTQFGGQLIIPAVAVAASAWFFLRLPPIITVPPLHVLQQQLRLEEDGALKELPLHHHKPGYVKALHFYKTKPGTFFRLIHVYHSDDHYDSLKSRIRLSADCLETARRELEERDPGRVLEYSQVLDELLEILRDMELYIHKCEKDKLNKACLRSCNRLLARVRKMESRILHLLKQDDQHGPPTS